MKPFALNFKHFKKIGSNEDHTIMQHSDGHQIKILHSALSPSMKKNLDSLAVSDPKAKPRFDAGGYIQSKELPAPQIAAPGPSPMMSGNSFATPSGDKKKKPDDKDKPDSQTNAVAPRSETMSANYAGGGKVSQDDVAEPNAKSAKAMQKGATESGWQPQRWVANVKDALGVKSSPAPAPDTQDQQESDTDKAGKALAQDPSNPAVKSVMDAFKADGGMIKKYATGGGTPPSDTDQSSSGGDSPSPNAPVTINIGGGMPQMPANLVNPSMVPSPTPEPQAPPPQVPTLSSPPPSSNDFNPSPQALAADAAQNMPYGTAPAPAATPPPAAIAPTQQAPISEPLPSAQAPQAPGDPYGVQAYEQALTQGVGEKKAGIAGEAAAAGQEGVAQASALRANIAQQQLQQKTFQSNFAQLDKERQAFQSDIMNQHIDPQHYMHSMDSGQKTRTAIGLILGGMGAGLLHQENPALQFLNAQINRDIEAQKANLGKSENLLNANMRQFGNMKDATDMTRIMQMDIVSNQLKEAAAKAISPMARANALKAAGDLDMQTAPMMSQIAMRRTLMSNMQGGKMDPASAIRMIVPEHQQAAASKELGEAQELVKARENLASAMQKVFTLNSMSNRTGSPFQTPSRIEALKGPITAQLSKATAGRFTEQDASKLETLWPKVTDDADTFKLKLSQAMNLVNEKANSPTLLIYGIDPFTGNRFNANGQKKIQLAPPVK